MVQKLNIEQAYEVHRLLHRFIPPELKDDETILDFIGKIVADIRNSDTPENFGLAIQILAGLSIEEMVEKSGDELVVIFTDSLVENKIISLCEFFRWLMR